MGRLHPAYCDHGKCIDSGHESFGVTDEPCADCEKDTSDDLEALRNELITAILALPDEWDAVLALAAKIKNARVE